METENLDRLSVAGQMIADTHVLGAHTPPICAKNFLAACVTARRGDEEGAPPGRRGDREGARDRAILPGTQREGGRGPRHAPHRRGDAPRRDD